MQIREFVEGDRKAVETLLHEFWTWGREAYDEQSLLFEELDDVDTYLASLIGEFVKHDHFLLAEEAGKIIGYISVEKQQWKPSALGPKGHVHSFFVTQNAQKRGVGQALFAAAKKRLLIDECEYIDLEVNVGNTGAQRFYEKQGLVPCNITMRGFIGGNDD